jgi:hypothetical protein
LNEVSQFICKLVQDEAGAGYELIKSTGDPKCSDLVIKTLNSLPDDWIFLQKDGQALYFKFKVTFNPNKQHSRAYTIDYESGGHLME